MGRMCLGRALGGALVLWLAGCSLVLSPDDFEIVEDAGRSDAGFDGSVDGGVDGGVDAGPGRCNVPGDCLAPPHAIVTCNDGECESAGCESGYSDCNSSTEDGCETDTTTSLAHCGACDRACAPEDAVGACNASTCTLESCRAGFADCDDDPSTGCETDLTSVETCGACTTACGGTDFCDSTGPTPVCSATCSGTECGDACVDTTSSVSHCGGCDRACSTRNVDLVECESSSCAIRTCATGFDNCDADVSTGCETELASDNMHCGACGVVCEGGAACVDGVCDPVVDGSGSIGHTCVVRQSNRVFCWGRNQHGQSSPTLYSRIPQEPTVMPESLALGAPALLARRVAASANGTCVIGIDGRLRCWGYAELGQLGSSATPPFNSQEPVLVTSADARFAARTFTQLTSGEEHYCAVDDMGGVWCWGYNETGGAGRPATEGNIPQAALVGLSGTAVAVQAARATSCALMADRTVRCWGDDRRGQLGNGDADLLPSSDPVVVTGLSNIARLISNWQTLCAIDDDGGLHCWGSNVGGALGSRTPLNYEPEPVTRVASGVLDAWMSLYSLCWRTSDGVSCAGRNTESQFGDGTNAPQSQDGQPPLRMPGLDGVRDVFGGRYHACGTVLGRLRCWGTSFEGQVARQTYYQEAPVTVVDGAGTPPTDFSAVSVASTHACGIRAGAVHCWGDTATGKGGPGLPDAHTHAVPGLTAAERLAAGVDHTCAIADSGGVDGRQVYCWGRNDRRQSGWVGGDTIVPTAVPVPGGEEIRVATSKGHTCAIQEDAPGSGQGSVWCWGWNFDGMLGRDTSGMDAGPGQVPGITDASDVAVGHGFSCAIRAGGSVSCWGQGTSGQLGNGASVDSLTPVSVTGLTNVVELDAGFRTACARLASGAVYCWGGGGIGELGDGRTGVNSSTPVPVSTTGFSAAATSIAVGGNHVCASYDDGVTRCWGWNMHSQLGDGTTDDAATPQVVIGLSDATGLSANGAGGQTTCGRLPDGTAVCWGHDYRGMTGGGHDIYFTPTEMELP